MSRTVDTPPHPEAVPIATSERIWYRDPAGLVYPERLTKFIPLATDPLETKLNATVRFVAYFSLLLLLFRGASAVQWVLAAVLLTLGLTAAVYEYDTRKSAGVKEHMHNLDIEVDPCTKRLCKRPSKNNPFMNVLMHEYTDFPQRPAACDVTTPRTDAIASTFYEQNLFSDMDDIFQTNTRLSRRQFYTNPATSIPNDQGSFASWLYAPALPGRSTCRDGDGAACAKRLHHFYPSV